jgi:hypothetical protein
MGDFYFRNAHWNSASCPKSFVSMRRIHRSLSIKARLRISATLLLKEVFESIMFLPL